MTDAPKKPRKPAVKKPARTGPVAMSEAKIVAPDFNRQACATARSRACRTALLLSAVWVEPALRSEIAYRGLTKSGELRHASFKELVE